MISRHGGAAFAAAMLVAGCQGGGTGPSGGATGAPDEPLAAAGEAYVVTILDDDGPFFDVRVDAIAPGGGSRPIAAFDDVHPAGWQEASPFYDMRAVVGPSRIVPITAERGGGMNDSDVRTLLLDLRPGGGAAVEIAGNLFSPFWGPDGQLAVLGDGAEVIDPRTGARVPIATPDGVGISPAWLVDGSGWAAGQFRGDEPIVGWLSTDGTFTAGRAATFQVTGLERLVGAAGGTLGFAVSDGPTSETAITEYRAALPGPCHCMSWASRIEPGEDPGFGDAVWDAAGTGIWLIFAKDDRRWLSHVVKPKVDNPVADLPPDGDWAIVGISADDRWVVTAALTDGKLVLVDTVAGAAREIARVQGIVNPAPMFGGWVR